jgi:hypothetical protein
VAPDAVSAAATPTEPDELDPRLAPIHDEDGNLDWVELGRIEIADQAGHVLTAEKRAAHQAVLERPDAVNILTTAAAVYKQHRSSGRSTAERLSPSGSGSVTVAARFVSGASRRGRRRAPQLMRPPPLMPAATGAAASDVPARRTSSAASRDGPGDSDDPEPAGPGAPVGTTTRVLHPPLHRGGRGVSTAARICACGCRASLDGRRANALYFDGACRVRAHRARRAATRPQGWGTRDVTVEARPSAAQDPLEIAA